MLHQEGQGFDNLPPKPNYNPDDSQESNIESKSKKKSHKVGKWIAGVTIAGLAAGGGIGGYKAYEHFSADDNEPSTSANKNPGGLEQPGSQETDTSQDQDTAHESQGEDDKSGEDILKDVLGETDILGAEKESTPNELLTKLDNSINDLINNEDMFEDCKSVVQDTGSIKSNVEAISIQGAGCTYPYFDKWATSVLKKDWEYDEDIQETTDNIYKEMEQVLAINLRIEAIAKESGTSNEDMKWIKKYKSTQETTSVVTVKSTEGESASLLATYEQVGNIEDTLLSDSGITVESHLQDGPNSSQLIRFERGKDTDGNWTVTELAYNDSH